MTTMNSEYLQVWQQVKQWPVELRQDLADEIVKSVASNLPASNGAWNETKNSRRCKLIDKDIQGTIDKAERRELELLTRELRVHRNRVAPLPVEGAKKLHQQLLEKKRQQEESDGES